MSNSILYYPTIEFRHEDYQWLWNAALFADKLVDCLEKCLIYGHIRRFAD